MILTNELEGIIVSKGFTKKEVALEIGMTPKTFYLKLRKGVFGSDEIEAMIELLEIDEPYRIFFAKKVTLKDTS